jgi:hypothetical protein
LLPDVHTISALYAVIMGVILRGGKCNLRSKCGD